MVVVVVVDSDYASSAQAWTRQAPWYMPCGKAMCVVCCKFVNMYVYLIMLVHRHGRGKHFGTCLVVKPCVVSLQRV